MLTPFFALSFITTLTDAGATQEMRLFICVGWLCAVVACWDPDAGVIESYTKSGHVNVSSTSGSGADRVIDSNDNTNWVSSFCLPSGYVNRKDVNVLYGVCGEGHCSTSGNQQDDIAHATDGSFYTTTHLQDAVSVAKLTIQMKNPDVLEVISVSGIFNAVTELSVYVQTTNGVQKHVLRTYNSSDNYKTINFVGLNFTVVKLELMSTSGFVIKEIAAIGSQGCTEQITVDFRNLRHVGTIRTRHWAGTNAASKLLLKTSADGHNWTTVAALDPNALHAVTTSIHPESVQYIALVYTVRLVDYMKVYCYEIDAWDENGIWGPLIQAKPQTKTFRDLLGVNGIWGWGTSKYSDSLSSNEGPRLYSQIASHGRNYHNLNWDVTDPDLDPGFANMAAGHGTQAMWWLNWDREYSAWTSANLTVDISIQFTNKTVPQSKWDNPERAAFHYGQEVAKQFGPQHGNGLVTAVEVGNEPWDYEASFYASVLKGMTDGLKSIDDKLIVIPGTFQAEDMHEVNTYIGTRVLPNVATNIDVINCHTYSFVNDDSGVRRGTFPENKQSTFNNIRPITRWRDANVPSKPIWVTEWGWDSYGVGEDCKGTECVSEKGQAIYGLRGLLLMSRSNIERTYWYFYANTECDTLFCRSGLSSSAANHFQKKSVFKVFEDFLNTVGNHYFLGVVQENDQGFIYALSNSSVPLAVNMDTQTIMQMASHIVVWLPVDAQNTTTLSVKIDLQSDMKVLTAWRFTGDRDTPSRAATSFDYTVSGNHLAIMASTEPFLLKLSRTQEQIVIG